MAARPDADGPVQERTVEQLFTFLTGALEIIDRWDDCLDIGARLQHVIDELEDRRGVSASNVRAIS